VAPSPIPPDTPPVPPEGLLYTVTADDLANLDLDCVTAYADTNWSACESWKSEGMSFQCLYSSCYPGNFAQAGDDILAWVGFPHDPTNYSLLTLKSLYAGPVSIMSLVARLVTDNEADTTFPSYLGITPRPRYLNQTYTFDDTAYLNGTSFRTGARELARQQITAQINAWELDFGWGFLNIDNEELMGETYEALVYTPLRCSTLPLNTIPWLSGNDISVSLTVWGLGYLVGLDMSTSIADPENWAATCAAFIGTSLPEFCAQFPGYYSYESLRDWSLSPSPWVHATYLFQALNEEYRAGSTPVGCLGVPA
jgi:hypothetical protein